MHLPVFLTLKKYVWTKDFVTDNPHISIIIGLVFCTITGIFTYHLVEKMGEKILKKLFDKF